MQVWWENQLAAHVGQPTETAWLTIGASIGAALPAWFDPDSLGLETPTACRAAIEFGVSSQPGSESERRMLRAVLDGWCSDTPSADATEAGLLLTAIRPAWFQSDGLGPLDSEARGDIKPVNDLAATGYPLEGETDRRTDAWRALEALDERYVRIRKAATGSARGSDGPMWADAAAGIVAVHGRCLLSNEIALSGAAITFFGDKESLTDDVSEGLLADIQDYGKLIAALQGKPRLEWWLSEFALCTDALARQTWVLAALCAANGGVLRCLLEELNSAVESLSATEYEALALCSSRLGQLLQVRRLGYEDWSPESISLRTCLLLLHFTVSLDALDPVTVLGDDVLAQMVDNGPASWPVARAIGERLCAGRVNDVLFQSLKRLPRSARISRSVRDLASRLHMPGEVMEKPSLYPEQVVIAAELQRANATKEPRLSLVAERMDWVAMPG